MPFRKPGEAAAYWAANREELLARNKVYRQQQKLARPWIKVLQSVRQRAEKKGVSYSLSADWAQSVWTGKCAITDLPFIVDTSGIPGPKPFSATVDRIDCKQGYLPDNCRFVLSCVNNFRGTMGDDEMLKVAAAILRIGLKRQPPVVEIAA